MSQEKLIHEMIKLTKELASLRKELKTEKDPNLMILTEAEQTELDVQIFEAGKSNTEGLKTELARVVFGRTEVMPEGLGFIGHYNWTLRRIDFVLEKHEEAIKAELRHRGETVTIEELKPLQGFYKKTQGWESFWK